MTIVAGGLTRRQADEIKRLRAEVEKLRSDKLKLLRVLKAVTDAAFRLKGHNERNRVTRLEISNAE